MKLLPLISCAILLALAVAAPAAHAQDYPKAPVRLVVPFAAGGSSDAVSRLVAQKMTAAMGQTFVVDNRGGAGGNLGAELVAKSKPDGYTLLFAAGSFAVNVSLFAKLPYDPLKDFDPVIHICTVNGILVVHPSVKANTVQELVALARAQPGTINYGSAGNGTMPHLAGELFKAGAKVDLTHVPYKGSGPALADLLGGQTQVMFANIPGTLQQVKAGKLRALAVTGAQRVPALPDVPTLAESVLPGFNSISWIGVLAPAGTPKDIVDKVSSDIREVLASDDVKGKLVELGALPSGNTPAQFQALIEADRKRYAQVIKDKKISVD